MGETTDMVSLAALMKLPMGRPAIARVVPVQDMDGEWRQAVIWRWSDEDGLRLADFDATTGEYLGDRINLPTYK